MIKLYQIKNMNFIGGLHYSEIESKRFGLNVFRGTYDKINKMKIRELIEKEHIDVCIIRLPYEALDEVNKLFRLPYGCLLADILVYYKFDLENQKPNVRQYDHLTFVEFADITNEKITSLVGSIFSQYRNHYSANPILNADLKKIYKEWILSFKTSPEEKSKVGWVVRNGRANFGLATISVKGQNSDAGLFGISPNMRDSGYFTDLIRFVQAYLIKRGCSSFTYSTQIDNYAVQKNLVREGFYLNEVFITLHVNSLLGTKLM